MIAPLDVDRAYTALTTALEDLYAAGEILASAKAAYQAAEAEQIAAGLTGRNEMERKALLYIHLEQQRCFLDDADEAMRRARLAYDLAQAEVDRVRFLVRLLALTPGGYSETRRSQTEAGREEST